MKKIFISVAIFLSVFVFVFNIPFNILKTNEVFAATSTVKSTSGGAASSMTLENPLGDKVTVYSLTGRIISVVLGLVGTIALVMFIYGGIIWMTSAGSSDKIKKGREAIIWSVIGMAVIFASYGLTKFLLDNITGQ